MTTKTLLNKYLENTLHRQKGGFFLQQVIRFTWNCLFVFM